MGEVKDIFSFEELMKKLEKDLIDYLVIYDPREGGYHIIDIYVKTNPKIYHKEHRWEAGLYISQREPSFDRVFNTDMDTILKGLINYCRKDKELK